MIRIQVVLCSFTIKCPGDAKERTEEYYSCDMLPYLFTKTTKLQELIITFAEFIFLINHLM